MVAQLDRADSISVLIDNAALQNEVTPRHVAAALLKPRPVTLESKTRLCYQLERPKPLNYGYSGRG